MSDPQYPIATPDRGWLARKFREIAGEVAEANRRGMSAVGLAAAALAGFQAGETIAGGTDLDSLTSTGQYAQNTSANATLALHYPLAATGGLLIVESGPSFITQTYVTRPASSATRVFERAKFSSNAWSNWAEVTTEPTVARRVIPASVAKAGGGTVVVDADGTVRVSANGPTAISLNDVFRPGRDYEIHIVAQTAANNNNNLRFRKAGADQSPSAYVFQGVYGTSAWPGSFSVAGYAVVSNAALLSVNGYTYAQSVIKVINSEASSSLGWHFSTVTRSGGNSTFYIGNGDFAPTDCTGFTILAGATSFNIPTTIKVWELP